MQVVGIDFGTVNVRISTWDTSQPELRPQPFAFSGDEVPSFTLPAVIAFQRQPDGTVSTIVGENADRLNDVPGEIVVVRNIKRWATSNDPYVSWHLATNRVKRPDWWNEETRCVDALGQSYPVKTVIRLILSEVFRQADIIGDFEWRAGCPVHAGLEYRSELAQVLSEFGGSNEVTSVVEEPILVLTLAHKLGTLHPGSYLVYDLGGGSFDCAIAEVGADGQMTVYSSHGHPLLGGATIDDLLTQKYELGDRVDPRLLRIAKEQLTPTNPVQNLYDDVNLSWTGLEDALNKAQFYGWTLAAMREAYISAKAVWKLEEGDYAIGNIPLLRLRDMPKAFSKDLNAIILFGGSTKSPYFRERLTEQFGVQKVIATEDLIPSEIPDPELTGLSAGACYFVGKGYTPLYVCRSGSRCGTPRQVPKSNMNHTNISCPTLTRANPLSPTGCRKGRVLTPSMN